MKLSTNSLILTLLFATQAWAVPVLQVGAPASSGDLGLYADYLGSLSDPTESNTAITSGGTIYAAGVYQNGDVLNIGGRINGENWSFFGLPTLFDTHNAILVVSVPKGELAIAAVSFRVDGNLAFYTDTNNSYLPNSHAPALPNIADFLFFDIGDFLNDVDLVPNFSDETGAADGEIKILSATGFGSLPWAHFDLIALETSEVNGQIVTTLYGNPDTNDVTRKAVSIPEPASLALLSLGLASLGWVRRRKRA